MPTIVSINVQTGERTERNMTAEEISALPYQQQVIEPVPVDPVDKLRQFLAANPDVAALI